MTGQGIMNSRFMRRFAPCVLLLACLESRLAHGKTIDKRPRPTILFAESDQFIAQDAWNSVALYGFRSADPIRRFPANAMISEIEATSDGKLLLMACDNGEIGVWKIGTGDKLWWHTSSQSGLKYIYGASFSWNGKALVVCNYCDFAVVFDALSGKQIGQVSFPPMQTNIMSATLSPDGTTGAFVDLGERLFTFAVQTGQMKATGWNGAWPVRYSADGKYIAFRNSNSGIEEQLRVIASKDLTKKDVGQFANIGHIKPIPDGGFLACARVGRGFDENDVTVGVSYAPGSGELKEVWKLSLANAENWTDFDPQLMVGVSTSYRLVTRLVDLRTGKAKLTIDNSANYRESILTYTSRDFEGQGIPLLVVIAGLAALVLAAWVVVHFLRRKKVMSPPT